MLLGSGRLNFKRQVIASFLLVLGLGLAWTQIGLAAGKKPVSGTGPYLFAGFKGNGEDGVYYAISDDGYRWEVLNQDKPIVPPTEAGELMRDPFLQRAPDGSFHMVWTWSWKTPTVAGYSTSKDLLHWEKHRKLDVMSNEPSVLNVWAPALYYDTRKHDWLLFWSSTVPGKFSGSGMGDGEYNHRIFATRTKNFQTFSPAFVYFDPGYEVIDATILPAGKKFYLLFKDERKDPLKKFILSAESSSLSGPWTSIQPPFTEVWSEGPAAIQVGKSYIVYYDHYRTPQHYAAVKSEDMQHWEDVTKSIQFPKGMRHGSFLEITKEEAARLRTYSSSQKTE